MKQKIFVKEFNRDLKKAKTPRQVWDVYTWHADAKLAKYGVCAMAYFDDYIRGVHKILKADRVRQKLDSKGHKPNKLTKKSARALFNLLSDYGDKLLTKLSKMENFK